MGTLDRNGTEIFVKKSSIKDVWQDSEYAFVPHNNPDVYLIAFFKTIILLL